MSRHKNKTKNYGTFFAPQSRLIKFKQKALLGLLILVFALGLGAVLVKRQSKVQTLADTKIVDTAIPGWWYQQYFGASVCDQEKCQPTADPDKDGLNNSQEFYYHSHPLNSHTVGDKTMDDGDLVANNFDPSRPGRMSFDEVLSVDNVLGESLVYNSDVKQIINQSVNLNKAVLPVIEDSELQLTHDNSKESILNYNTRTKQIFDKHFPQNFGSYIEAVVKAKDQQGVNNAATQMSKASAELMQVPVPNDFLQMHKYILQLFRLLPDVMSPPTADILEDEYNAAGNSWYDKTQAAYAIYQKINLEQIRLQNIYQNAK